MFSRIQSCLLYLVIGEESVIDGKVTEFPSLLCRRKEKAQHVKRETKSQLTLLDEE